MKDDVVFVSFNLFILLRNGLVIFGMILVSSVSLLASFFFV